MILNALYDYYHRCGDLPRKGMELKELGFLIVIDKEGHFLRFEDRRKNKKQAQTYINDHKYIWIKFFGYN